MSSGRRRRYFPSNPNSSGDNTTTDSLHGNARSLNPNDNSFNTNHLFTINYNYYMRNPPSERNVRLGTERVRGVTEIFSEAWVWLVKWEMLSKLSADRHISRPLSAPPNPNSISWGTTTHQPQEWFQVTTNGLGLGSPPPNYWGIDPHFIPAQTQAYGPPPPRFPPASNSDIQSGMPAPPPRSYTIPSAYFPAEPPLPSTIVPPTDGPEKEIIIAVMGFLGNTHACPEPSVLAKTTIRGR